MPIVGVKLMNCSPISLSALYPRYMRREYTFNVFLHSNRLYCFGPLGKLVQFEMKVFESIMKGKSLLLCTLGMLTCFFVACLKVCFMLKCLALLSSLVHFYFVLYKTSAQTYCYSYGIILHTSIVLFILVLL